MDKPMNATGWTDAGDVIALDAPAVLTFERPSGKRYAVRVPARAPWMAPLLILEAGRKHDVCLVPLPRHGYVVHDENGARSSGGTCEKRIRINGILGAALDHWLSHVVSTE